MTKAEQIRRALMELPGASNRRISRIIGCEPKEVSRIRGDMRATGEIPEREVDADKVDDI